MLMNRSKVIKLKKINHRPINLINLKIIFHKLMKLIVARQRNIPKFRI